MRKVRVRELMLAVAVVGLALGWEIDRARVAYRLSYAEETIRRLKWRLDGASESLERIMGLAHDEAEGRREAEAALAECRQGRGAR